MVRVEKKGGVEGLGVKMGRRKSWKNGEKGGRDTKTKAEKKAIGRPRKEFETTEKEMKREKDRRYRRVRKGRMNS